jgi:hypothetical protein
MKKRRKILIWLLISTLSLIPIVYFLVRVSDATFRDNAIGNWFATVIGVLVGIPIGLEINRHQQKAQEKVDAKKKIQEDRERLNLILDRLERELAYDREKVEDLQQALTQSLSARLDLFEWAITIVDSFSFAANSDLIEAGLQVYLPSQVENHLYTAYRDLNDLLHMVKQATAAMKFFYGYSTAGEKQSNEQMTRVQDLSRHVLDRLNATIQSLSDYKEKQAGG